MCCLELSASSAPALCVVPDPTSLAVSDQIRHDSRNLELSDVMLLLLLFSFRSTRNAFRFQFYSRTRETLERGLWSYIHVCITACCYFYCYSLRKTLLFLGLVLLNKINRSSAPDVTYECRFFFSLLFHTFNKLELVDRILFDTCGCAASLRPSALLEAYTKGPVCCCC